MNDFLCLYTEELQDELHDSMMAAQCWALIAEAACEEWNDGEQPWLLQRNPGIARPYAAGYVSVYCSYCGKQLDPALELDLMVNCDVGMMPIRDGRHRSLLALKIPVEVELDYISTWTDMGTEYDVHLEIYPWGEEYGLEAQLDPPDWA